MRRKVRAERQFLEAHDVRSIFGRQTDAGGERFTMNGRVGMPTCLHSPNTQRRTL
jgi:hypothetical protein